MNRDFLIIEGSSNSREANFTALKSAFYQVREAVDGKSGLAQTMQKLSDLAIIDRWLPDINGFDLVSQVRALAGAANIPIGALIGFVAKGDEFGIGRPMAADQLSHWSRKSPMKIGLPLKRPANPSWESSANRQHPRMDMTERNKF